MNPRFEEMIRQSKEAMDLLAPKPEFPEFAFGLFEDGRATHHRITKKGRNKTPFGKFPYAFYETYAPSQIGEFRKEYVSRIFKTLDEHFGGILEIAAIPFTEERVEEVLSLGKYSSLIERPGGYSYRIVDFDRRKVKLFYSPKVFHKGESQGIQ